MLLTTCSRRIGEAIVHETSLRCAYPRGQKHFADRLSSPGARAGRPCGRPSIGPRGRISLKPLIFPRVLRDSGIAGCGHCAGLWSALREVELRCPSLANDSAGEEGRASARYITAMLAFIKAYKWFILPVAVLLVALIAYRATRPKVTVEAAAARTGPLSLRIAASGLVEADSADLSFQGSGRIMELYVKEGDRVRRSDVLARLAPMGAMPDTLGSVDVIHAPYDGSVVTIYQRRGAVVTPAQPVVRVVA